MYEKTHGNGLIEWLFNFERTDLSSMTKETSSLDL